MVGVLIAFVVVTLLACLYDKLDVRKKPRGKMTLEEIEDMFNNSPKDQFKRKE